MRRERQKRSQFLWTRFFRIPGGFLTRVYAFVLATTAVSGLHAENEDTRLRALFAEHWEHRLREDPLFATRYGDDRYNDRLADMAQAAIAKRATFQESLLERLSAIDVEKLPAGQRVHYRIFKRMRELDIAEHRFKTFLTPITNRGGFHVEFPQLPDRVPLKTPTDYRNYIARLSAFRRYAREHIELLRRGASEGYALPRVVLDGYEGTISAHVVEKPEESLLYAPFRSFPDSFAPELQESLRNAGRKSIADSVVPAYREFLEFMTTEYLPAARKEIGASSLPDGKAFYEHRVRLFTTLDITPKEVHEIGLGEVARIRQEMEQVIRESGFEGSFAEFLKFLRTDSRFYAKTPHDLLEHVSYICKRVDEKLPTLFKTLPRMPFGLVEVPEFIAPKTTTAYYSMPSGDGTKSGTYWLNTYDLKSRPLYELEALSLHEAEPGHHLQLALQQEMPDLPPFRRFASFTAYIEGWALYAERLGLEMGFYKDPYNNFGRLTYEMWRAVRLVVDTGMHYFGWSRQRAIDYMASNTALALHNCTTEIDRYIAWPGQALGYKIGELKIRELRAKAERSMGERFDIREFHDVVLRSGAVPLSILTTNVEAYIQAE